MAIEKELPKGWDQDSLGNLIKLNNGKSITRKELISTAPYVAYGSNGSLGNTNKYLIDYDSIIIGRVGAAGEINRSFGKCWISDNAIYVSQVNEKLDLEYLFWFFLFLDQLQSILAMEIHLSFLHSIFEPLYLRR